MSQPSFRGRTVVVFEGLAPDRAAGLIEERRGRPLRAPAVRPPAPEVRDAVRSVVEALGHGEVDGLCLSTAPGVRMLLDGLREAYGPERGRAVLRDLVLAVRTGRPTRVLASWSLSVDHAVSAPEEWPAVLDRVRTAVDAPAGPHLAVEQNGRASRRLTEALERDGTDVWRLPTHPRQRPDDRLPLKNGLRALIGGEAAAALFTAPGQVENVWAVAAGHGWGEALRRALGSVVVGARDRATAAALRDRSLGVDRVAEPETLAALVRAVADETA